MDLKKNNLFYVWLHFELGTFNFQFPTVGGFEWVHKNLAFV